ncbi:MAG: DUF3352 domain-containing protein [Cyanobacteria bacterium P01_H01_bin.121]
MSKGSTAALIAGAAVVVAGGAGAYWYFQGRTPAVESEMLASISLIPEDAVMATFISTDAAAWEKLEQFGNPELQQLVAEQLETFQQESLESINVSYETDIKPWVDGLTVSVLPPKEVQDEEEPNLLILVGVNDQAKAQSFEEKLKGLEDVQVKDSDYKGVAITEYVQDDSPTYKAALGDYVAFSTEQQSIELAIDSSQSKSSLESQTETAKALNALAQLEDPLVQVYIPNYAGLVSEFTAAADEAPLPPDLLQQLNQIQSVVAGFGVNDQGVRVKAVTRLDPLANVPQGQTSPDQVVNQFPTNTLALISGYGISQVWSSVVAETDNNPQVSDAVDAIRQQTQTVGIDADQDIFSWMSGEFGIGLIPATEGLVAQAGMGIAMVLDSGDPATTNATFEKLNGLVGVWATVEQTEINGKQATEWKLPTGEVILGYGWVDDDTFFLGVGEPVINAIAQPADDSLAKNEKFQAAISSLPSKNDGYFYMDIAGLVDTIKQTPFGLQLNSLPPEANATVELFDSVAATNSWPDNQTSEFDMLIRLTSVQQ